MYCYSALERFAGYDKTQTWRLASSFYHIWLRSYALLNIPRPCSPIQLQIIPDVIASLDFRQECLEKIITPQSVDIGKRFWSLNLRHSMIYKTRYSCLTVHEATSELKIIESQPYFRCRSRWGRRGSCRNVFSRPHQAKRCIIRSQCRRHLVFMAVLLWQGDRQHAIFTQLKLMPWKRGLNDTFHRFHCDNIEYGLYYRFEWYHITWLGTYAQR